ncbi:UNVERIFIED_CONTAM: hypothetical protein Slati_0095600 [Sesamum latifolium]|uniref:Uncharacterized protein n=1 Tax=Sesamum latifolium TaxID=2727402 RepID=A0AAW2Y8J9_9LAMI
MSLLGSLLLAKPVPVSADSSCARWKWFEGCLGALDGTYIDVRVPDEDRARYRTRKGSVSVNVLGVCDREMRFIYVLAGWEAKSGFRWNEAMQMIAVSDQVFDNYAKIDPFAKTLRFKLFPYYPSWSEIFGKDRATGEHAEDIYNASNNMSIEAILVSLEYYVPSPDINALVDDHNFMNSFTQSTAHLNAAPSDTERVSSKKRKKSISTVDEKFDAKFDTFVSVTDNRLGDLAKYFGVEQEESNARRQVWSAVESMSDLTLEQKCVASKKLVNNKNDLDLFLSISTAAQEAFVKLMVDGKV